MIKYAIVGLVGIKVGARNTVNCPRVRIGMCSIVQIMYKYKQQ